MVGVCGTGEDEMANRIDLDSLQEKDSLNKDLGIEYVELEAGR